MATNSYEKILEKTRRDNERQARDAEQRAKVAEIQNRASSIVAGQPFIGSFRIMDPSSEVVLRILIDNFHGDINREVRGKYEIFPDAYRNTLSLEFEKLSMYGMISGHRIWIGAMWELYITQAGLTYFENKERAIEEDKKKSQTAGLSIGSIVAHGSQFFFGDVNDSTLSIDNRISQIEQLIDEKGGEDAAELKALLAEVQEMLENIKDSRFIPKNSSLFTRLSNHFAKHGWFYGSMVTLFGTYAMQLIQG